jgi:PST family polysaccharide transporter
MLLQVASWALGFIIIAKNLRRLFLWMEIIACSCYIGLVWVFVEYFGLKGAGISFFVFYGFFLCANYLIMRKLTGFRWSAPNKRIALLILPAVAIVFGGWYVLPFAANAVLGSFITLLAGFLSLKTLCTLVPLERFPRVAQRLLVSLKLASPSTQDLNADTTT